jgi:hypothetical protein
MLLGVISVLSITVAVLVALLSLVNDGIAGLVSSSFFGLLLLASVFAKLLQLGLNNDMKEAICFSLIFIFGGMCAFVLFVAAKYVPARACCSPVFFVCISCGLLMGSLEKPPRILQNLTSGLFLLFFIVGLCDILNVYHAAHERALSIEKALESDRILITEPYPCQTKYSAQYGLQDVEPEAAWPNDMIVLYYGLDQLVVKEPFTTMK